MNETSLEELQQMKQIEEMKRQVLTKILTKEAFERLARVRTVNPAVAAQTDVYLLQSYQNGKLAGKIDDIKLKEVLKALSAKRGFSIKRV